MVDIPLVLVAILAVLGQVLFVVIDVALVRIAVRAVLVQIAPIVIDISLILVPVNAVRAQIFAVGLCLGAVDAELLVIVCKLGLVVIDMTLIGVAIRTVFRQIFLVVSDVFLVVLNVLLLRGRIRALGIGTTGEQTGKSNHEHTSTDHMFCVHRVLSYLIVPGVTTTLTKSNTRRTAKLRYLTRRS